MPARQGCARDRATRFFFGRGGPGSPSSRSAASRPTLATWRVVASARTPVADFPADATFVQGDVGTLAGAQALARRAEELLGGVDLGRKGSPTDISELIGFLVSERAAWITGSSFMIDGGEGSFVV